MAKKDYDDIPGTFVFDAEKGQYVLKSSNANREEYSETFDSPLLDGSIEEGPGGSEAEDFTPCQQAVPRGPHKRLLSAMLGSLWLPCTIFLVLMIC